VQDNVSHENAIGGAQQGRRFAIKCVGMRPVNIRKVEIRGSANHVRLVIHTVKFDRRMSARDTYQEPATARADVNHVSATCKTVLDHEVMVPLKRKSDLQRELLLDFLIHSFPHGIRHWLPLIPTGVNRPKKPGRL
jgi:hypothetical protein